MNPIPYQSMAAQQWNPQFPPNPPPSTTFWTHVNLQHRLKDFHETLILANAMQKELELLLKVKEAKGYLQNEENVDGLGEGSNLVEAKRVGFGQESKGSLGNGENVDGLDEISNCFEGNRVEFGAQELISVEAANEVMSKLRFLLEPFRVVTDEGTPWEEKSATVRLNDKINKSKRNKQWRKRKRQHVAEKIEKERVQFEKLDQEADEWRAREIAKDIAQRQVEKMKEIAKQKAKEERKKLEAELELALMVEKLQELRSIRIQKLKRQGHFLAEEDDKFLERVRAAVEEEERQAKAAADTDAAKDAIAAAEESRKVTQLVDPDPKEESIDDVRKEDQEVKTQSETTLGSETTAQKQPEKQEYEGHSYGAYDYVASLPPEFYHYYHGSNTDMGTLIEVRRTWDLYIRPGGRLEFRGSLLYMFFLSDSESLGSGTPSKS